MNRSFAQIDGNIQAGPDFAPVYKYMTGILTAVLCFSLALFFWPRIPWPEILPIKRVQVAGNFVYLSPVELEERAANIIRGGFFTVNVDGVKRELQQEEWIDYVAVRRVWPDSLVIYIKEHEPVAVWDNKALLSNEVKIFSPTEDSFPTGLPILTGPRGSHRMVLEKYEFIKARLTGQNMEIATLTLTERRAWQFRLTNGTAVMLGRKNVVERLDRFFRFVLPHHAENLLQAISIDMRYTNGFAIKWANPRTGERT